MKISRLTPVLGTWMYHRTVRKWVTGAVSRGDKNAVQELVAVVCSPDDHHCRDTATRGLSSLVHPAAIDCFCEEVVRRNDTRLARIGQERRYAPTGEAERALFFLGTGEMDSLLALDLQPDHPLLARGYAMADRGVKEGVCAAAIASKNAHILADVLAGTGAGRRTSGWTPSECEVLIAGRMQESREAELWRELFAFPLPQAVQALHALRGSGFVPDGDELTLWLSLREVLPGSWTFPVPGHKTARTIEQPQGQPLRLCFSPQGDLLATSGSGGTIRVRDVRSGTVRFSVHAGTGAIRALTIAGDPQRLVCIGDDMGVRAWEIESGRPCWELPGTPGGPGVFCISPEGNRLFIGNADGSIHSIDTTGDVTVVPYRHHSLVCCLNVSPDGRTLAVAGQDHTACLLDWDTGTVCHTFTVPDDHIRSLDITPDNPYLIIIGNHPRPVVYNAVSGLREQVPVFNRHHISRWCLSRDGRTFSFFSDDRTLWFLDLPGGLVRSVEVNGCDITACVTTNDNATLIAGCSNGRIRFYEIPGGKITRDFPAHKGPVTSLVCSPDGRYLASCGLDGMVKLWNMDTTALVRIIAGETGEVTCLSGTPDGSVLFAGSTDGTVRVFDQHDANLITIRDMFTTTVLALALSPDGTVLACAGGNHTLMFWNRNDGSMLGSCEGLKHTTRCLAFDPDGSRLVSGGWDGNVRCWQVTDGTLIRTLTGHTSVVTACAISPDGRVLATGSNDTTIRLWDMADGRLLRTMDAGRTEISALACSHSGDVLASGEKDGSIRLFCLPGGTPLGTVEGIPGKVTALLVSGDDQALVAGYDAGILAVYSLDTRQIISSVPAHTGAITGLVMVPDTDMVVSAGRDGKIRQWDLPWTKPLAATTPADISRAASCAGSDSPGAQQTQWEFLERLLKCRFNNEIGICPHRPLAGVYDIQIVG